MFSLVVWPIICNTKTIKHLKSFQLTLEGFHLFGYSNQLQDSDPDAIEKMIDLVASDDPEDLKPE
jgi:hypothetical protein